MKGSPTGYAAWLFSHIKKIKFFISLSIMILFQLYRQPLVYPTVKTAVISSTRVPDAKLIICGTGSSIENPSLK